MRRTPFVFMLSLFLVIGIAGAAKADPIKFARYPHICNGRIAFSYHGDIWVANEDGSSPYRLTAHVAMDNFPRFSPDGEWIAFTSNRLGNNDIWVVSAGGGVPKQVTFSTTGDNVLYWTPDGERIVFSTSRGDDGWGTPLYTVSAEGDLPVKMDMDRAAAGMIRQDGSMIAFNRLGFRYWRKGYRGNNNTDIWVQDLGTLEITQLTDLDIRDYRRHTQDAYPMWGADGMIYFMSERDGIFNIWKIASTGGQPVQVTRHSADGVQYPSISPDGRTIIYENEFELWKISIPDGRSQKIPVSLDFDPKYNLVEYLPTTNEADGFTPSPDGDFLAVDFHGEIFIIPTDDEVGEKTQVTSSGWRDRYETWSPDGSWIAHVSDEGGDDEQVWLYEVATGTRRQVSDYESLKTNLLWSHDSARLAFIGSNRLFLTDVERGRSREIAYNEAGGFRLQSFTADDEWILYTRGDEHQNTDLYLYNIGEGEEYDVTPNPWRESGGELTSDGKTLVFTSNRSGGTTHLFAVPLARLTEDPDDPLVRARKQESGAEESDERGERTGRTDRGVQEGEETDTIEALRIELEGIDRRARQLTSGENGVSGFFLSADGETIYFVSTDDDGRGLFSIGIDGEGQRKVTEGAFSGLTPSADRKSVYYRQGSNIYQMPLNNRKKDRIDFSFTVTVDKPAEWRQIFFEAWRIMKYRFYDENMHGVDWATTREQYEPLLPYVGMNQDIHDLANEMIGELNASHTGVSGPSGFENPDTYRTTYLGFEVEPDGNALEITHIYQDGPADKEWIDLDVGEYVVAIDGMEVDASVNYWKILNHTLNDYVTVRVASTPRANDARDIRIQTVNSLRNIQYQEWVKSRRKMVEEWSDGQIAYVHIRSMNRSSLTIFENEINQYWDAKGIIVDIRYNGGGNTDQQILDILERRPYEFWNNRWGARSWGRRPRQAIAGPKVMLINARSGSDSEVTPLGFRDLELGRVVGTPTYGAVIATGSYRLIHGGSIRTPGSLVVTWDPTKPNNYGINLENYGVPPDVWAENGPDDELNGFDRELKAAVDEALRMLREGTWQYGGGS